MDSYRCRPSSDHDVFHEPGLNVGILIRQILSHPCLLGQSPTVKLCWAKTQRSSEKCWQSRCLSGSGLLAVLSTGQLNRLTRIGDRFLVFGRIGFDLRPQGDPLAEPYLAVERGLFVQPEEKRAVVVDAIL